MICKRGRGRGRGRGRRRGGETAGLVDRVRRCALGYRTYGRTTIFRMARHLGLLSSSSQSGHHLHPFFSEYLGHDFNRTAATRGWVSPQGWGTDRGGRVIGHVNGTHQRLAHRERTIATTARQDQTRRDRTVVTVYPKSGRDIAWRMEGTGGGRAGSIPLLSCSYDTWAARDYELLRACNQHKAYRTSSSCVDPTNMGWANFAHR